MIMKTAKMPALMLASAAALTLAACESSGNYRVGWVGDTPPPDGGTASSSGGDTGSSGSNGGEGTSSSSSGGGTASSSGGGSSSSSGGGSTSSGGASTSSGGGSTSSGGGSTSSSGGAAGQNLVGNLIVTAGNTVIGVAGKSDTLVRGGVLPTAGVVTAKVTGILAKTGQTLVKVGEGTGGGGGGLILDGVGGKIGALVGIDLGKGTVIAAPEGSKSLIGVNVLAKNPGTGQLATVSALSGGKLLLVDVNNTTGGLIGKDSGLLGGVTGTVGNVVGGVTGGATGGTGGALSGVSGTVGQVVGGVTSGSGLPLAPVSPSPQGGVVGVVQSTVGAVTNTVGGVTGGLTGGLLKPKKK